MNVLSFISRKGGGGKTTLASNLAVAFERKGHSSALLDLGPETHLARWKWETECLPDIYDVENSTLVEKLPAFSNRYDLVVVDTPPASQKSALVASQVADLICIPVRVGSLNVAAVRDTLNLIGRQSTKEGGKIRLILTQRRATASYEATAESLNALNVEAIENEATMRAAYRRAMNLSCSVFDLSDTGAIEEITSIAYDLQQLLDDLPDPSRLEECVREAILRKLYYYSTRSGRPSSEILSEALDEWAD